MGAEPDKFIIAAFAIWAGDFAYFEKLLRDFSPPQKTPAIDESVRNPEDFIRATGALRLRQFWQKRGEFRILAQEYKKQQVELTDQPIILEAEHLRASVWRLGERDFLMQGYLKDLMWQEELFTRARRQAGMAEHSEPDAEKKVFKPLGARWVVPGSLFLQVELTDLGLLEAAGLWTQPRFPKNAEAITGPFLKLLSVLDGSIDNPER